MNHFGFRGPIEIVHIIGRQTLCEHPQLVAQGMQRKVLPWDSLIDEHGVSVDSTLVVRYIIPSGLKVHQYTNRKCRFSRQERVHNEEQDFVSWDEIMGNEETSVF